jgi:hypothetical protein
MKEAVHCYVELVPVENFVAGMEEEGALGNQAFQDGREEDLRENLRLAQKDLALVAARDNAFGVVGCQDEEQNCIEINAYFNIIGECLELTFVAILVNLLLRCHYLVDVEIARYSLP